MTLSRGKRMKRDWKKDPFYQEFTYMRRILVDGSQILALSCRWEDPFVVKRQNTPKTSSETLQEKRNDSRYVVEKIIARCHSHQYLYIDYVLSMYLYQRSWSHF